MPRPAGGTRLRRCQRVRSRKDFVRVQRSGARTATRHFVLLRAEGWRPEAAAGARARVCGPRIGITVSRKVGSSVARNRIKRQVREVFRHHSRCLPAQEDVVLIARRGAAELTPEQARSEILELLTGGAQ